MIFAYVTLMHFITVDPLISEPLGTKGGSDMNYFKWGTDHLTRTIIHKQNGVHIMREFRYKRLDKCGSTVH